MSVREGWVVDEGLVDFLATSVRGLISAHGSGHGSGVFKVFLRLNIVVILLSLRRAKIHEIRPRRVIRPWNGIFSMSHSEDRRTGGIRTS